MATSRRRERELARRRHERRLARAEQARIAAKRRRRVAGITTAAVVVVVGAIVAAYVLINAGHNSSPTKKTASTASATCAKVSPDPAAAGEPSIPQVGKKPTSLVSKDLITGKGAVAKSGDKLVVKYVGVACSTGKAFDASYTDGAKDKEYSFTLGKSQVIPGWDKGLVGVKAGGRRELVIPPSLAYGANGSSGIKANETLEFVIDVVSVKKA